MATETPPCTVTGFRNIKDRDNWVCYIRLSHHRDRGKATIAVGSWGGINDNCRAFPRLLPRLTR